MKSGVLLFCLILILPLFLTSGVARDTTDDFYLLSFYDEAKIDDSLARYPGAESKYYTVRYMFATGKIPNDLKIVEEAISEIARNEIGVELELIPVSFGSISENLNLKVASGIQLDLTIQRGVTLSSDAARGILTPLDALLKKYGEDILNASEDFLKATSIDGIAYAVPTIRDMAASYGLIARRDVLYRNNIDIDAIKTIEDIERMFAAIKAAEPEMIVTMPQIAGTRSIMDSGFVTWDSLGDSLGVLMNHGNNLEVVNLFETEEYKQNLDIIRNWNRRGFIWRDASIAVDQANILVGAGKLFSYFSNLKPGFDRQESLRAGKEMVTFELKPPFTTTSQVAVVSLAIPSTSKQPEKAMQFLNLMYGNEDIINLFNWGIEDIHYVRVPDSNVLIRFPEGVDAITSGFNLALGWQFGNQLLSYIWEGNSPFLYSEIGEFNDSSIKSNALGFTFDSSELQSEIAKLSGVMALYRVPLENGAFDPQVKLPEFINALRDAGIDKVIDEKQRQLDEWAIRVGVQ